jgi:hypothetical protein
MTEPKPVEPGPEDDRLMRETLLECGRYQPDREPYGFMRKPTIQAQHVSPLTGRTPS